MRRLLPALAVLACFATASVAEAQEESKLDRLLKGLDEKIQKLEKQVEDLTKKLQEQKPVEKLDRAIERLVEKFGGELELDGLMEKFAEKMPAKPDLDDLIEKLLGSLPELPGGMAPADLPLLLEGMDWETLLDGVKAQLEAQFGEFFEGFDVQKLLQDLERKFKPEPRGSGEEIRAEFV